MSKLRDRLKELSGDYFTLFEANLVKVKPLLNSATPPGYTFHGVDHSAQLEKYVEQLLPDLVLNNLNANELFILLNGIYYHDIGMTQYKRIDAIDLISSKDKEIGKQVAELAHSDKTMADALVTLSVERENHNVLSQRMVYNSESHTCDKGLIDIPEGNPNYAQSISFLCLGHRDYKNENNETIETLKSIPHKEAYDDDVHTQLLACLVRLADELDITHQRARRDVLIHLQHFLQERSFDEWINHQLFSKVEIDNYTFKITLIPDTAVIRVRDKVIGDRRVIRHALFSKRAKIEKELEKIQPYIYDGSSDHHHQLGYSRIDIKFDEKFVTKNDFDIYQKAVEHAYKVATLEDESDPTKAIYDPQITPERISDIQDNLFDRKVRELNSNFEILRKQDKLISIGNFLLPSGVRSRFYFNTNLILPNNEILNLVTDILFEKYKNTEIDTVIGIEKAGRLIAPILSLKLKCNYTYLTHSSEEETTISFEKNSSLKEPKKILLVTDVISSGKTIRESKKTIEDKFDIKKFDVATIFCSDLKIIEKLKEELSIDIFYINDEYQYKVYKTEDLEKDSNLAKEFELLRTIKK